MKNRLIFIALFIGSIIKDLRWRKTYAKKKQLEYDLYDIDAEIWQQGFMISNSCKSKKMIEKKKKIQAKLNYINHKLNKI